MKIKTVVLKEMVSKAVKGAGNNKLLPLTSLICISGNDGVLTLTTFDGSNYLYITEKQEDAKDFYITVAVEQFSKFISKLTCESVELTVLDNALEVKGNGTYKIDIPLDENGDIIQYPNPLSDIELSNNPKQINLITIKTILNSCRSSLATTLEVPCFTGYYCGDTVIATNSDKIAGLNVRLFDEDILVSAEMMTMLDVMTAEKIDFNIVDSWLVFSSSNCTIVGRAMDGIEDYPVEPITEFLETSFDSVCTVNKNTLLSLLDRIALFVGPYDDKAIRLTFTEAGLTIQSLQTNGVETIGYESQKEYQPFTCQIDIEYLLEEVKSVAGDLVEIHYGLDNAIKIVEGNMTIVIALMVEEEA